MTPRRRAAAARLRRPLMLVVVLLLGAAALVEGGEFKPIAYKPCKEQQPASAATAVSITSVTGDLPARASSTFIVHVGARPERPLAGGKITMEIKALGVKVATRHFNICKDLDVQCPVPAGEEVVARFRFPVPFYAITMKAEVVITAKDEKGEHLLCLEAPEVPVVGWNKNGKGNEEEPAGAEAVAAAAEAEAAAAADAAEEEVEEIMEEAVAVGSVAASGSSSPALRRREMAEVAVVAQEVFLAL